MSARTTGTLSPHSPARVRVHAFLLRTTQNGSSQTGSHVSCGSSIILLLNWPRNCLFLRKLPNLDPQAALLQDTRQQCDSCPTRERTTDPPDPVLGPRAARDSRATPGRTPTPAAWASGLQTSGPAARDHQGAWNLARGMGVRAPAVSETQDCVLQTPRRR